MKAEPLRFSHLRYTAYLLCCLFLSSLSLHARAQSAGKVFSFDWKNKTLSKVFTDIENAAQVHFSYNPKDLDIERKVDLKIDRLKLNDMIDALSKKINAQYKIVGETIMIQAAKDKSATGKSQTAFALKGHVLDADNQPVEGAIVSNNNTNKTVMTTKDGAFTIPASTEDIVYFDMMGFKVTTIIASDKHPVQSIVLKQKVNELDNVVVTALGIKREARSLGYATAEVDGKELKKAREPNVINSLAGKVPGLVITSTAGGPAGSSRVILRGSTTITGNNQPLYVVDGIPIDNSNYGQVGNDQYAAGVDFGDAISGINPDDIDKISVLKGPSASALYGSRAGNGVIIITTKRGSAKKDLGIEFNSTVSMEKQLTHFDGYQYLYGQGSNEKLVIDPAQARTSVFSNFGPRLDPNLMAVSFDGTMKPYALVKDNIDNFFRTGATATNTISIMNASDRSSFRFAVTDMRNKDIVPKSDMHRTSFTLNGTTKVGTRFSIEARGFYLNEQVNNRPALADDPSNIGNNFVGLANNIDQAEFATGYKDDQGHYVDWGGGQYRLNPYWVINEMKNTTRKDRIIAGFQANYTITSWMSLQGRASTDFAYLRYEKYTPPTTPGALTGRLDQIDQKFSTTEADLMLNMQKQVSSSVYLSAKLGTSLSRIRNEGNQMIFTNQQEAVVSPSFFQDKSVIPHDIQKHTNSFYGMLSMGYKNFLFFDATLRNDMSSTLPKDNYSYMYPSLSGSFIFSDAFKMQSKFFTYGKFRASIAEVGNDTDPYQLNLNYDLWPKAANGHSMGYVPSKQAPNPNLKSPDTRSYEFGTDLKFYESRLGFQATYYSMETRNQIIRVPAPTSSGFTSQIINAGAITNKGLELLLTGRPIQTKNFSWDVSLNFARNKSNVKSLAEGVPFLSLSDARWLGVSVVAQPNAAYGSILGYDYMKDDKGEIILDPVTLTPQPSAERTLIGKGVFDWTGGMVTTFNYKNFSLGAVVDVKYGAQLFSMTNLFAAVRGSLETTLPGRSEWIESEEKRMSAGKTAAEWKAAGNVTGYVPQGVVQTGTDDAGKPVYSKNTQALDPSVYWGNFYSDGNGIAVPFIYNASYVKMREITVSYHIVSAGIRKAGFKDLTVAVVSRNPFIIYKEVPNVDPDSNYNNGNGQGFEYGSLPSRRSWGFNLNFRF